MSKHQHGGNLNRLAELYGLRVEEMVDFSVNVNPLGPPQEVAEILRHGLRLAATYPEPDCQTLRRRAAAALGVDPEELLFGNGAIELIYLTFQALRPGLVLIPGPTFREYEIAAKNAGARVKQLRLSPSRGFVPSPELLRRAARGVGAVFLCNPNNPTGNLIPRETLLSITAYCERRGILLVVDESFLAFHPHHRELTLIGQAVQKENLLVLRSLTKFYCIPGLRVGYAVGHRSLLKRVARHQPPWSVNGIAQEVAAVTFSLADYDEKTRSFISGERQFLASSLSRLPGLKVFPGQADYLLIELRPPQKAPQLVEQLGRRGVVVRDCSNFSFMGNRCIRVAVKDRASNLRLINTLKEILPSGL